ncbi:putative calcium/calmodulin dependent protein kinase [Aspergillus sclerotioniger CBS 115572]|uniref:Putative calcium/calmodulin dependent protein kinase n=1 Tax=Aspergillus sclerotioniger CBS 115572 TaxID=1450535 RepID=A0A317WSV2_9EURO|nr:putative calcium/calmodulin dependent protein kinase [Aspergillus sclerotioniger CBS 115572]PWY89494.1 putative calcium/calmodulin dependent protein kinase [Aspergillus sclerotioniger CBS 115572]
MFRRTIAQLASAANEYTGASGSVYRFKELLQERPPVGRDRFVLKDIPKDIFDNFHERIQPQLPESPHIRSPCDTIPGQRILVYKYLTDDFLDLVKKGISLPTRKQILKASLRGIADLHERDVVHLDTKPDNIMVECQHKEQDTIIEKVQIIDLENAAHLPKGRCIKGMLAGNDNWRSPEAHFKGRLNKPTDIFSFGAACIYAMLGRVIFGPDDDFYKHQAQGALPAMIRLQRQVSYFGDPQGISGLLKHISDEDFNCKILQILWEDRFEEYIPYKAFSEWADVVDPEFKDLIQRLTNLDPTKRPTAYEALRHPWFQDK